MKKIVELEKSKLLFRKDDIVEIRLKDNVEITVEDAKEQFKVIDQNLPNKKVCMLIVPGFHNTMDVAVKKFANSAECLEKSKAEAVIVDTLAMRIVYNFLKKFTKKNMQLFDCEKKAIDWLKNEQSIL